MKLLNLVLKDTKTDLSVGVTSKGVTLVDKELLQVLVVGDNP